VALATNRGFRVYTTQPLKLKQARDLGASLLIVEMVDRSNLLALVGFNLDRCIVNLVFKSRESLL